MSDAGGRGQARGGGAGAPPPGREPAAAEDGQASVRAAALLVVAVLVGLFVFAAGLDRAQEVADAPATSTTIDLGVDRDAAPPTTSPEQAGTILAPASTSKPAAEVKVYVANAADPAQRIAGDTADELETDGWQIAGTNDAPLTPQTRVYYVAGFEGDARLVAEQLGFAPETVTPMPDPVPLPAASTADILVMVGTDQLTASAGTTTTTA